MLTYSFENIGHDSLYEYLYKCIRKDILDGKIRAGEKLPSKRSFAKNLGVSTITVENAYAQLVAEGYLYAVPKSGYYAAEIGSHLLTPSRQKSMAHIGTKYHVALSGTTDDDGAMLCGPEDAEAGTYSGHSSPAALDLSSSRMNQKQFPFTIWAKILRQVLSENREALMTPAPGIGVKALREAIAGFLREYQGMDVTPDQIIIGAGTEYLYTLLIQLLGQNAVYALEDPGYVKISKVYKSHLVETKYIPMDKHGLLVDALSESNANVVHISPSHHYPTGITMPITRRYELLGWADQREDRYIIEDDYDCEFRLTGRPIPPLQSIDRREKVIYMNTFTKSLASTIRISYMVLPKQLLNRFQQKLGFYSCTVSNFEQYALARFIADGFFAKHINRMRNYYRGKRDELINVIQEGPLKDKVTIHEADAGLHFLMRVNTEWSDEELVRRAAKQGIRIACLSQYFHVQEQVDEETKKQMEGSENTTKWEQSHEVIVNYPALEREDMKKMVLCLEKAWFEA